MITLAIPNRTALRSGQPKKWSGYEDRLDRSSQASTLLHRPLRHPARQVPGEPALVYYGGPDNTAVHRHGYPNHHGQTRN